VTRLELFLAGVAENADCFLKLPLEPNTFPVVEKSIRKDGSPIPALVLSCVCAVSLHFFASGGRSNVISNRLLHHRKPKFAGEGAKIVLTTYQSAYQSASLRLRNEVRIYLQTYQYLVLWLCEFWREGKLVPVKIHIGSTGI